MITKALLAVAVLTVAGVAGSPAQAAATWPSTVEGTGGVGLLVRPGPSMGSGGPLANLAEGTQVTIDCYLHGQTIAGYWYTGDVWQHLTSPVEGYVTDTYLNTSVNGPLPGEPACGTTPPPPAPPNPFYRRADSVAWAKAHAMDSYAHWELAPGCTWFVSRALWNGGFPTSSTWTYKGAHGRWPRRLPGTVAAWSAPEFVRYLSSTFSVTTTTLGPNRFRQNRVPEARTGDVIAYDWQGDGRIDHVSMVVDIAAGQYPEVAEWGVGTVRTLGRTPYRKRGWTWSENHHQWLQAYYGPGVRAYVVHINGGR